ncbi:aftiphilin-like isoform X3 [Portunus trituberculatus]|uniref:aftiphilin-like isoform X3 n=1 Tax=Portunus trituberculatus TaxID=210409 RepID=UPI001E1CF856|nr:aftiphilin-like isoform X3 [Portunus trituberculatus]
MAFQMIPPRLSSSPPPLDSLPSVACPGVDEDDEFDHFSSHNASFDITVKEPRGLTPCCGDKACTSHLPSVNNPQLKASGLSDKLPPTPESSPSRFPGIRSGPTTDRGLTEGVEGTLEDSISQDSGVDSSNHPHEFSPQPQGDGHPCSREDLIGSDIGRVDRELSDFEQNDVDDFGDFQGVCSAGSETPRECVGSVQANSSQNWDSSQISSHPLSQESETSKCKENDSSRHRAVCSPPPLDCVAEDTLVKDDDADFGEFSSHEAGFDLPSGANINDKCDSEKSLHLHQCQPASEINIMQNECKEVSSGASVHQISLITERLQADGNSEDEDLACKSSRVTRDAGSDASEDEQGETSVTFLHSKGFLRPEDESKVGPPVTSEVTQTPSHSAWNERVMGDGMATSQENVREDSEVNTVVVPTTSASGDGDEEQRTGDKFGLGKDVPFLSSNESAVPENDITVKEGEMEPSSDTAEHISDICENENESDFGDFNQAKGDNDDGGSDDGEDDDDDDDDLDFGDLRKQVEEGTFGDSDDFGDFGDFSTGFGDGNEGSGEVVAGSDDAGDGEDDFGDFTASANTNVKAEFDDFGDFVVPEKESAVEDDFSQDFSDDFGDFSAPENSEALRGFTTAAVEEVPQFQVQDGKVTKTSPILQKLESLVTKWIPRTPEASQEESCSVPLLHQAIESDAFVWRQLENLESSAALRLSWSSTQAHNFFLSSVNVDARNILFGQKWSSSVPLFAQTLSFSPLTPAKSTEGSGGSGGVGLAGATKELPADTFPATTPKQGQHKKNSSSASSTVSTNGSSEEQIPPAKFDWTSSGLTNPLEGPAYSSSLFGLDLLLTNTKIGKGATNALLASLEQEFLSEGGDKGSGGRAAKSPPTPSPLVQQILGGGMSKVPCPATPLQSLAPEVRQVVTQLPNLSFMRSRVLMFPIRGDQ